MKRALVMAALALAPLAPTSALAQGTGACTGFAWPLDTELAWLSAAESEAVDSGARLAGPPAKAITLALKPSGAVSLPVEPSGKPKSTPAETFAGTIAFDGVPAPGVYQVSLSSGGWIDVVQNGAALRSVSHTGKKDCPTLHKSVRFEIGPGPLVLQLTSMPAGSAKVTLRPAS